MNAILILLALLSLGTIASRQGGAQLLVRVAATPLVVGLGYLLFSPAALAFVPPSTTDDLLPALLVGCSWQAIMLGLSVPRVNWSARFLSGTARALLVSLLTALFSVPAVYLALRLLADSGSAGVGTIWSHGPLFGAAVLVGGLVAGTAPSRASGLELRSGLTTFVRTGESAVHEEGLAVLIACLAVTLWFEPARTSGDLTPPWATVPLLLGLGATAVLVQRLAALGAESTEARTITLIGLTVLLTGFTGSLELPTVPAAFFFGFFLAMTKAGRSLLGRLAGAERPVRMVVLVLLGAYLNLTIAPVLVGLTAGLSRAVAKLFARKALSRAGLEVSLPALLSPPRLAAPLAISLAWGDNVALRDSGLLTAVVVALSVSDLLTLVVLLLRPPERQSSGQEARS